MKRFALFSTFVALLALAAPSLALAKGPTREPLVYPPEGFLIPAGFACEFDLQVDFLVNREITKTWSDAEGDPIRSLVTGSLVARLTNVDADRSIVVNIGGPSWFHYNADGTISQVFLGRSSPLFEGVFYLSVGRHDFLLDGNLALIAAGSKSGRSIDICAMLSPA